MIKLNSTTWKHIAKDDLKDRLEVVIGDDKQPDFKPQIKIQRWDNEVNSSFRLIDNDQETPKISKYRDKIKYITSKKELHFYNLAESEELREGGYEFEVILKEKPTTNKLEFTIQTKGLKFYYQPPLTEEKLEEGQTADETHIYDKDGNVVAERPENVVGSYAVYHATKGGVVDKDGKDYKVGKAFHIYRPKITDANGNWTWGQLNIDEESGILTIEIDQSWLDNVVYPVKIDPTFGYDTAGGSAQAAGYNDFHGSKFTSPSDIGTFEKLSFYSEYVSGSDSWKGVITDSSKIIITNGVGNEITKNTGWDDLTYSDIPTLSSDTVYYLGQVNYGNKQNPKYDTGESGQGLIDQSNSEYSPQNPTDGTENNYKFSIYCTYTAGEETATPFTDDFNSYNNGDLNGQGGWSGSADFDVQGTTVYEGAKAVNATPSSPVQTISKTGTGVSDGKVSFYVRMTATNKDCVYKWKDGATDVIWFRVRDNGYFSRIYNVSSWQNIKTYSTNTWYLIEIEWRSSDHYARYRITVAGNTPGSWDVDWESPASTSWSNIDTLIIAAENGTHYIDHIAEEPYSPPSADNAIFFGTNF